MDFSGLTFDLYFCDLVQVFTLIFTVEMLVKMVAMDPYNYFQVRPTRLLGDISVDGHHFHGEVMTPLCHHGYR